jgi:hypothetical protein
VFVDVDREIRRRWRTVFRVPDDLFEQRVQEAREDKNGAGITTYALFKVRSERYGGRILDQMDREGGDPLLRSNGFEDVNRDEANGETFAT